MRDISAMLAHTSLLTDLMIFNGAFFSLLGNVAWNGRVVREG
jgi:hypothetical protein